MNDVCTNERDHSCEKAEASQNTPMSDFMKQTEEYLQELERISSYSGSGGCPGCGMTIEAFKKVKADLLDEVERRSCIKIFICDDDDVGSDVVISKSDLREILNDLKTSNL